MLVCPRANGAKRRSGRKPGARVLILPGYFFYTWEIHNSRTEGTFVDAVQK